MSIRDFTFSVRIGFFFLIGFVQSLWAPSKAILPFGDRWGNEILQCKIIKINSRDKSNSDDYDDKKSTYYKVLSIFSLMLPF